VEPEIMPVKDIENDTASRVLNGKEVAASVRKRLAERTTAHREQGKRAPGLAVVLVGDDPASALYVQGKIKACKQVGIESFFRKFEASAAAAEVKQCVQELNQDPLVDGILVQLPLPAQISADEVLALLQPDKDVDGLTAISMGLLMGGKPGLRPCTPSGIIELLDYHKVPIEGSRAVVIGRSNLVGKPIALLLMQRNATVTMCHSRTKGLDELCRSADILVVAAGKRTFVKGDWIKPGACVIDVGIHHDKTAAGESSIAGDVDFAEAVKVAGLITPVPGGVGPMTIAMLLANTLTAYEEHLKTESCH
jgi:methylenetetrahydrofolate dehydrogenase (NADP+) / methenyltetrahydrofolate cyclohydrolase